MNYAEWQKQLDKLKINTYALYLASLDKQVPWRAKVIVAIVLAYALSPVDLIPDFIPVIGYLDDLLLLPLGIWFAIRLVPKDIWLECQILATTHRQKLPRNLRAAMVIVSIWLLAIIGFVLWVFPLINDVINRLIPISLT